MHKSTYKTHLKIVVTPGSEYNEIRQYPISTSISIFDLEHDLEIAPAIWAGLSDTEKLNFVSDYAYKTFRFPEAFYYEELFEEDCEID